MQIQTKNDSTFRPLDSQAVARYILAGAIDPQTKVAPANDPTATWETFDRAKGREQVAALQEEIQEAIHRLYRRPGSTLVASPPVRFGTGPELEFGLEELSDRLTELCSWDWSRFRPFEARLRFADAWLADLRGRQGQAIAKYEGYLQQVRRWDQRMRRQRPETHGITSRKTPPLQRHPHLWLAFHDPHLTLIAYNNHAVLTLRSDENVGNHATAIGRLARLAMWHLLPGACFNLLNLMNVAWKSAETGVGRRRFRRIDAAIGKAFNELVSRRYERLPEERRGQWGFAVAAQKWKRALGTTVLSVNRPFGEARDAERRRKAFVLALAESALRVYSPGADVRDELRLWPHTRGPMLQGTPGSRNDCSWVEGQHQAYGEAVALLYPREMIDVLPMTELAPCGDDRCRESGPNSTNSATQHRR